MPRPADTSPDRLHLLGIRHHGPGSARAMVAALDAADPAVVLIEGPPDADDMIGFAASPAMTPPVALLIHAEGDPSNSSFYPFAAFSPEWQAMRWALARGRPVRFIDLPMAVRLADRAKAKADAEVAAKAAGPAPAGSGQDMPPAEATPAADAGGDGADAGAGDDPAGQTGDGGQTPADAQAAAEAVRIRRDPLAYLATIAGYDDSEAWWNALIEQSAHGAGIFAAIETAMTALREAVEAGGADGDQVRGSGPMHDLEEQRREAHMRLAIGEALGETAGPVAVVCGAWHVPALRRRVPAKDDRALLKGLPKVKVTATWVPWTETRLAAGSGYAAGVVSPGWYAHLWAEMERGKTVRAAVLATGSAAAADAAQTALAPVDFAARWQARVAALLRKAGRPASTASVIEAARLALALAELRDLALPGLSEMQEASLATLCDGERTPLRLIERQLVVGTGVGAIDEGVPQMPLAADLARWQRRLKLKPEALDAEVSLDLRSETGLAKSLLLHRLRLIDVAWGTPLGAGSSRGTFRENWKLRWDPELSVKLAEALVWGTTVELAAGNAAVGKAEAATSLEAIAELVRGCLEAGLEAAANATIARLQVAAAGSGDTVALAAAVPPLAGILRYGTAREMPTDALRLLVVSLVEAVCADLAYACRNLQAEAAAEMRTRLAELDAAMLLIDDDALSAGWRRALTGVADDGAAHPLLAGLAVRTLYDQSVLDQDAAALRLSRALSPAVPPAAAGDWLDGFIGTSGQILLHDQALRGLVDRWLVALGAEDFTNLLPMLRRAFSSIDRSERRRLLDEIAKLRDVTPVAGPGAQPEMPAGGVGAGSGAGDGDAPGFAAALPLLLTILGAPGDVRAACPEGGTT